MRRSPGRRARGRRMPRDRASAARGPGGPRRSGATRTARPMSALACPSATIVSTSTSRSESSPPGPDGRALAASGASSAAPRLPWTYSSPDGTLRARARRRRRPLTRQPRTPASKAPDIGQVQRARSEHDRLGGSEAGVVHDRDDQLVHAARGLVAGDGDLRGDRPPPDGSRSCDERCAHQCSRVGVSGRGWKPHDCCDPDPAATPASTATVWACVGSASTMPFENSLVRRSARVIDATDPTNVVRVPGCPGAVGGLDQQLELDGGAVQAGTLVGRDGQPQDTPGGGSPVA